MPNTNTENTNKKQSAIKPNNNYKNISKSSSPPVPPVTNLNDAFSESMSFLENKNNQLSKAKTKTKTAKVKPVAKKISHI